MLRLLPFTARKPGGILRSAHSDADGLAARLVAVARLDLDDVGAEERELVGAVRPRQVTREVEDPDAGERLAHVRSGLLAMTAFTTSNSRRFSAISSGVSWSRLE